MSIYNTKVSVFFEWGGESRGTPRTESGRKSPQEKTTVESQKFLEARELHDDKKLAPAVDVMLGLIKSGDRAGMQDRFKDFRVEGIGNFGAAILRIDLLNRAKDGRVIPVQQEGSIDVISEGDVKNALVKNGSNLAKLVQLYIIAHGASVQFEDFKKSLAGIDGNLERFTMQGLSQTLAEMKSKSSRDQLSRELDSKNRSGPIKAMALSVYAEIEKTGVKSPELRARRRMGVEVRGETVYVNSYSQTSAIDLSTGKMRYSQGGFGAKEYPFTLKLGRDRDNKNNPLMIESAENRENMKNAMKLMNFVHFATNAYMGSDKKGSIRDMEKPFTVSGDEIKVNDGFFHSTNIVSNQALDKMLTDAWDGTKESPERVAEFLNSIFRDINKPKVKDNGSIYIGNDKPISKDENPPPPAG